VIAAAAVLIAASAAAAPPRIEVGRNVLVSADDRALPHEEVQIGTHPTDARRLVACSMVDTARLAQRKMHTSSYVSLDGGETWKMGPNIPESGDPVCGFGPDGTAYFGAIGDSPTLDPAIDWHFKLFRSDDGVAWEQKSDILTGDRPWLAFDATKGPGHGWLYLTYQSRAGVLDTQEKQAAVSLDLTHSTDRGATWSLPRAYGVITAGRLSHSLPTMMATLSDGTVVISNWQNLKKKAAASEDEPAATFPGMTGPPTCEIAIVLVDTDGWKRPKTLKAADKYCSETFTTRTVDALAIDQGSAAFKDRIYLAWTDARSGTARIHFTYSADRGATWSSPRVVDDLPPGLSFTADSFMPTLAVNADGVVGLTWNDRRDHPDNIGYTTRFTASLDGGDTWLPSVRVSDQPAKFRHGGDGGEVAGYASSQGSGTSLHLYRVGGPSAGDTAGLRADANGVFHALWIDNRTGTGQLYTAPVRVSGTVARQGGLGAGLADISEAVAVDLTDVAIDPKTQVATLELRLRNKAKQPVKGRLLARILSSQSEVGTAEILNADNGESGSGAVFDFTPLLAGDELKPDASTPPKTVKLRIRDPRPPRVDQKEPWKALRQPYADLDLQVLGEAPAPAASGIAAANR